METFSKVRLMLNKDHHRIACEGNEGDLTIKQIVKQDGMAVAKQIYMDRRSELARQEKLRTYNDQTAHLENIRYIWS